jgi:putative glycosyltransferase (TIGR04372 family)
LHQFPLRRFIVSLYVRTMKILGRRSRFLAAALACFNVIFSVFPRPLLFVLLLLPIMMGGKRLRLKIANGLFQIDYPSEAMEYLRRSSGKGELSRDEQLFLAMCLFLGLGRFREAMSHYAKLNEIRLAEAVDLGLGKCPFRILDNSWVRYFGDTATLDYVIKLGILEGRARDDTILYLAPKSSVANRALVEQIANYLRLVEDPADLPFDVSAIPTLRFDYLAPRLHDGSSAYVWEIAGKTYERWHQERRGPLLTIAPEIEARGWAVLHSVGVPKGAWFVALHVRESRWGGRRAGLRSILNADIASYLPAIAEITRRGGWVVRMGDPDMSPLPALAKVVDYCHSDLYADWMDVFIVACCRFMLGTSSGPAYIPALYGVPSVLTNWWPPAARPWHASDIFVPKMPRRSTDGRYLTLSETLREPFSWCHSRRYLADRHGVHIEDSDPDIIRGAVKEMLERLEGDSSQDVKTTQLRARADGIYELHNVVGMGQLARDFVRRYHDLLV